MSDLFAGLRTGVRMPELKMNDGPLPNITSLPAPYNGSISAKINYNSTLLGDIQPYEIGQPKRIEDQINYVNVPDKVQKIIPPFGGVDVSPIIVILVLIGIQRYILPLIFTPLIGLIG